MTAHANTIRTAPVPHRRGACPGLSAPMPTGDGLLVRLRPIGTIALAAFANLCAAARRHGNGVIEITSRGSIQVRGLSVASAPRFAAAVADLGIAAEDGVPICCNPLAGMDADEVLDATALAAELRQALMRTSLAAKLSGKVSVAIDGGGVLGLARLPADIRLHAQAIDGDAVLRIGVGGDDASAADVGIVAPARGVEAVMQLLDVLARRGRNARARDIVAIEGAAVFRSAIADLLNSEAPPHLTPRFGEAIGLHRLRDGSLACGIALAFGHADATLLDRLADTAAISGASGVRTAPGRTLFAIGLTPETAPAFVAAAEQLRFIVRADDPRRSVVACAGAPICAAAHIAARALAPLVANEIAPYRDDAFTVHISGCAKGCAHAAPAALTVVGTRNGCALVADGSARDVPFTLVATNELPVAMARFARQRKQEAVHV
jgi:precorrin-3B synthase